VLQKCEQLNGSVTQYILYITQKQISYAYSMTAFSIYLQKN